MTKGISCGMANPPASGCFQVLARICAVGLLTAALPGLAAAQAMAEASHRGMRDPTRPPAQFLDPNDAAQAATPPDSGLQTIKRTGKRYLALLNGEWVKPGDRSGEAVVVKIEEHAVVLQYPDGRRETIGMYPDVELRPKEVQSRPKKAASRMAGR